MSHRTGLAVCLLALVAHVAPACGTSNPGGGKVLAAFEAELGGLCDPDNPIHNCPSSFCSASSDGQAGLELVSDFGANPGNQRMFKHVPDGLASGASLVVGLHACDQNAAEYAQRTGWNDLADTYGFAVLYPEQKCENNAMCCFNWAGEFGDPTNMIRGQGENQGIIDMIDTMIADHGIDPDRVYITGFSGGAAEVNLMLATWPDRFEAGASIAGVPYYCTDECEEVSSPCMTPGRDRSPQAWADLVHNAYASVEGSLYEGRYPRVSIWHGSLDTTVAFANLEEQMEQWTAVHGIDQTADEVDEVKGQRHSVYQDASGVTLVETYELSGGQHGVPVDPGSGEDQCGSIGSWAYDKDICSSYYIAQFFGLLGGVEDMPPTVRITEPQDGARVSDLVMVQASASDDQGVDRVEFAVDDQPAHTAGEAPYTFEWDTTGVAMGDHTLTATAFDTAGQSFSHTIMVTKGVVVDDPPQVALLAPQDAAALCGPVTLVATASDDLEVVRVEFELDGQVVHSATTAPYLYDWDTDAATGGGHTLVARAVDSTGQTAEDTVSVRVGAGGGDFTETFPAGGPASSAWDLADFVVDEAADHTGGDSASLYGVAEPDIDYVLVKKTSVQLQLGSTPVLSYVRMLDMECGQFSCGFFSPAAFRVKVQPAGDPFATEEIVDFVDLTEGGASHLEDSWTERTGIDLSSWAGQEVMLHFYVGAPYASHAYAWIDDVTVSGDGGCSPAEPPHVVLDGATPDGCCVELSGSVTDPAGMELVLAVADLGGVLSPLAIDGSGAFVHAQCNLVNGDYAATVTAVNAMGARAEDSIDFTIDGCTGRAPQVAVTAVSTSDDCVYLEGNATDPDGDTLIATVTIDAAAAEELVLEQDGSWSHEACGLSEGGHIAVVRAVDPVGLEASDMAPFTIGAGSSPVLTVDGVATEGTCVAITGTVSDPDAETPAVSVSVDGSYETPVTVEDDDSWSFERCQLEVGSHQAVVKAVDAAGLQDQETVEFTITGATEDDPRVTITELSTNLDCVYVEGTAIDPNGERLAVTARIDDGSPNPVNPDDQSAFSYDRCLLEEGEHTLTILAINRSGLRASAEETFTITAGGGQSPEVTIVQVTTEEFCAHLEGTATDPDGEVLQATVTVDGTQSETIALGADGSWSYDWCGDRGHHQATVRAEDPGGQVGTATADFEIKGATSGCATPGSGHAPVLAFLTVVLVLARRRRG